MYGLLYHYASLIGRFWFNRVLQIYISIVLFISHLQTIIIITSHSLRYVSY